MSLVSEVSQHLVQPSPEAGLSGLPVEGGPLPPSVNYHLWQPCNMRCRYCFATFEDVRSVLPQGHLPREQALELVQVLARRFQKITFAGGEPLLCPWLPELVRTAHAEGATTMVVTNGSRLRPELLEQLAGRLDWVALSADSASEVTHLKLGRAVAGRRPLTLEDYEALAVRLREAGVRVKLNTVVTSLNVAEDLAPLVRLLRPERWKVLRVLPVDGQNDGKVEPLLCPAADFQAFVARHQHLEAEGVVLAVEDNEDMRGSYAMVDPAGRFFESTRGRHHYSAPLLEVGLEAAWAQVRFSLERFERRGGHYDFGGGR
jgi:radical S-adenosyl methionine domain-containing protein 2